jgi:hypothetical protein
MAVLSAEDLLAGSAAVHDVEVPAPLLDGARAADGGAGTVRVRALTMAALTAIARASRDDPSLVPVLVLREALVEPSLTTDQVRALPVGLVHHLVSAVHLASGLSADGEPLATAAGSPVGRTHLLLAQHFGWTPEQVARLTPGQVAVYLAGLARLLDLTGEEPEP